MIFGLANIWRQASGLGKIAYPFRVFSNICAAVLIVLHHIENQLPISYFEYVSMGIILTFAHFFFIHYVKSGCQHKVAVRQLTYDFLFVGWYVGVINLSVLPSFIFILAITVNYIAVKGFHKIYRVLLVVAISLVSLAFQDFEVNLAYGNVGGILSLSYGTVHFLLVALVSFNYAVRYQRGQKALETQRNEIEAQRGEIALQAQKLKTLNKSLVTLNTELETKVSDRAKQLRDKNKKLTEYAFINAHKLRAPVASIMGLVQFFDYEHSDEEHVQIRARLKESTHELEQTIGDIRKKLEDEGLVQPGFWDPSSIEFNAPVIRPKQEGQV